MTDHIRELTELLLSKDNHAAYQALKELQEISEEKNAVYAYMDLFTDMIESDNSYIRTRGLLMIASTAKWDVDNQIDEVIDSYLRHITDVKPITARQCIKALPQIAQDKPELKADIIAALKQADGSRYAESMRPLVMKDIRDAIEIIAGIDSTSSSTK
ncbi:MAG: SufBD protein [Lachnospiraceae bacterium]